MLTITDQIQGISTTVTNILLSLGILFALAQCFFGLKLHKLWIAFMGFIVGFCIGATVSVLFVKTAQAGTIAWIAGLICGILAALVAYKIYRVGVFVLCAFNVFFTVYGLLSAKPLWLAILLGVLCGLVAGILTLKFMRPVTICSTAVSGGMSAASSIIGFFHTTISWLPLCLGLVIAVCGIVVQSKTTKKE